MPGDAILALRELASKPDLLYSNAIAISMTNLFAVSAEDVVKELALWTGGANEYRRRHAARVLLVLSRFAGPKAKDDGWPAMPGVSAADGTFRSLLAQTWVDALAGTDTAGRAWDALRRWIMDADGAPELEDTVVSLAIEILRRSTTERRRFHLLHWRLKHPESSVLKRIHDAIDRRSTNLA
jgi:hypothetical protein